MRGTVKIVTIESFFGKRNLLINIKIKAVMNKNIFYAIFRFISLNHFQAKIFFLNIEILQLRRDKNFALQDEEQNFL